MIDIIGNVTASLHAEYDATRFSKYIGLLMLYTRMLNFSRALTFSTFELLAELRDSIIFTYRDYRA